jgi:hypothetical protein
LARSQTGFANVYSPHDENEYAGAPKDLQKKKFKGMGGKRVEARDRHP